MLKRWMSEWMNDWMNGWMEGMKWNEMDRNGKKWMKRMKWMKCMKGMQWMNWMNWMNWMSWMYRNGMIWAEWNEMKWMDGWMNQNEGMNDWMNEPTVQGHSGQSAASQDGDAVLPPSYLHILAWCTHDLFAFMPTGIRASCKVPDQVPGPMTHMQWLHSIVLVRH